MLDQGTVRKWGGLASAILILPSLALAGTAIQAKQLPWAQIDSSHCGAIRKPSGTALNISQVQKPYGYPDVCWPCHWEGDTRKVAWSINPPVGSISPDGLYQAPPTAGFAGFTQIVAVTATIQSEPRKFGAAYVTLAPLATSLRKVPSDGAHFPIPPPGITVEPTTVSLGSSQTQLFIASQPDSCLSLATR